MIRLEMEERSAVITNLNTRVEKHGPDEKVVGTDIDVQMLVPIDKLNKLAVGCNIDYGKMFYDKDGALNQSGILKLIFDRNYEEHIVVLSNDNITKQSVTIDDVTIKKFSATLDAGREAKLTFQIQCHASDEVESFLRQALIKDSILVEIQEPRQQDMLDQEADYSEAV